MAKKLVLILLIGPLLITCKKPVLEVDPNFVGNWSGGNYWLVIDSDGTGYFQFYTSQEEGYRYWDGDVRASDSHLKIGNSPNFIILEFPTVIDSQYWSHDTVAWEMKIRYPKSVFYGDETFQLFKN